MKSKKKFIILPLFSILLSMILQNCTSSQNQATEYYTQEDYASLEKYDTHVHVMTNDISFVEYSEQDNFKLLTINVDVPYYPSLQEQQDFALHQAEANPNYLKYATAFTIENWKDEDWQSSALDYLKNSFAKGAIAIKVWKNIGMELQDDDGNFIMIDHPRFAPIFEYLEKNNITVIGHLGEPRNCWLPVEEMTVSGDKNYFASHPEYHMYLHPEYPSYEDQLDARDRLLARHPKLKFVGAHLGSLEYSVDALADRLDKYPNMAVDMAARISHLQHQAVTDWQKVHDFFIKYQDRIIYGTDLEASGEMTAEELRVEAREKRLQHWRFFTTDELMRVPKVDHEFKGLKLPKSVIDKIYRDNAKKWFSKL